MKPAVWMARRKVWRHVVVILLGWLVSANAADTQPPLAPIEQPSWRQPVGLWLAPGDKFLYVAYRTGSALGVIDVERGKTVAVHPLGGQPMALAGSTNGALLIPDGASDSLHVLRVDGPRLAHRLHLRTGAQPMQAAIHRDGRRGWVSCRASQCVEAYDLERGRQTRRVQLPFAPHCLALSADETVLMAADAFRGNIVAIDTESGEIRRRFEYPATNIRGLAFSSDGKSFYFSHQIFSEKSMITRDSVFWGAFMTNNLRQVPLATFLDPSANPLSTSQLYYLGDARHGAGDPSAIAVASKEVIVLLSGVDEVGIDRQWPDTFQRVGVGRRPEALTMSSDSKRAFVANRFDDTVSIVDIASQQVERTISLGPTAEATSAMRGERLFHDAKVSLDGWYSCQSCHIDGHTNGSNADTMGDASFGAPKNTPSLLGVSHTGPWGWTGRFQTLEDQIKSSISHSMQGGQPTEQQLADLIAYLQTLQPRQSPGDRAESIVARGKQVFESKRCDVCHAPPNYTSQRTYDVGLDDGPGGNKRFNPPSLRGVATTAPYLHDGRAANLEDAVTEHGRHLGSALSGAEREELLAFLKSL